MNLLSLNADECDEVSKIYRVLNTRGKMIGELDVMIAGIVLYNDETLVSRDEHFSLIQNLSLKAW